ncbi:MAG: ABC transporter substrate-binding protein, partial [Aestuariivirgaceae bacterium]
FHLKKAGMENLKVDLHTANTAFGGAIDAAVLYQAHAKAAGIDINVVREADDGYWVNVWMKKPWSMSYWGGRPTEDWMFTVAYAAGGSWNESFWSNGAFMKLLVEARAELDQAKRAAMYAEMQKLVRDDGGAVIPMYANNVDAVSKKVATPDKIAGNWDLDGWKSLERWWFA